MKTSQAPAISVPHALAMVAGHPEGLVLAGHETHRCGSCSRTTTCSPAKSVLSANFSTWEDISADGGRRWLCGPCAWTYKTRPGLHTPLIVNDTPAAHRPTPSELRDLLNAPIPLNVSIIFPVNGKRTLAPLARWGMFTFDSGTIPWTSRHAKMMTAATALRDYGANEWALSQPSPPEIVFASTPVETHETIRELWRTTAPARQDATLLALIQRLSRKDPS